MKPFTVLLLFSLIGAMLPSYAQKNEISYSLVDSTQTAALSDNALLIKNRLDTGWVTVAINWANADCSFAVVDLIPAFQPASAPLYRKILEPKAGQCIFSVPFSEIPAGLELGARVIENTGRVAFSGPGIVSGGWPPLLLYASFGN